jgi:hypothetical protein
MNIYNFCQKQRGTQRRGERRKTREDEENNGKQYSMPHKQKKAPPAPFVWYFETTLPQSHETLQNKYIKDPQKG